jgi:2-octaprenyl-6-methoxyphenol hydroxylase
MPVISAEDLAQPIRGEPMADENFDLVIGGGSFVGLALALGLAKSAPGGFRIAIVERMPPQEARQGAFDGRAVALTASAKGLLEAIGVWPELAPEAQPVERIDITDSALEMPLRSVLLHFEPSQEGEPTAYVTENARLRQLLFAAAETCADITLISPDTIRALDVGEARATITLASGRMLVAPLIVAADGQNSALRGMAGIKVVRWASEQVAITGTITHEKPHGGRAVQHFLPSGPFAILPMTGNRASIVWTERAEEARRIMALDEAAMIAEIEKRAGLTLGQIALPEKLASFPLSMTLARAFAGPRVALAGDAAHALHWIAGQGLNHGLKDAAALAEVLIDAARLGLDIGALNVLQRYERWRRFDSATSAATGAALNLIFSNENMPARMIRQFGLGLVDRLPPLKSVLMREAAGLTGELPKLLQGRLV